MPTLKKKSKSKPTAAKTKTAAAKKPKPKAKKTVKAAKTKVVGALAKVGKAGAALVAKIKKDLKPVKKPHRPPHRHPLPGGNELELPSGAGPDDGGLTPGGGLDGGTTPIGAAAALPRITDPLGGAPVAAGVALDVDCTTNRADLRYILEQTDVTPPSSGLAAAPMPNQFPATPAANDFTVTVPGANLAAGRVYRLRVFVNPNDGATPPNADFAINVRT